MKNVENKSGGRLRSPYLDERYPHKRLRERYLALALIALGEPAIKVAKKLGRSRGTVEAW